MCDAAWNECTRAHVVCLSQRGWLLSGDAKQLSSDEYCSNAILNFWRTYHARIQINKFIKFMIVALHVIVRVANSRVPSHDNDNKISACSLSGAILQR